MFGCNSCLKKILKFGIAVFLGSIAFGAATAGAETVEQRLSQHHFNSTPAELEALAGGREQLIAQLLEIHRKETPPFAGVRATKLLLNYASEPEVAQALADDIAEYKGLARVITAHLDKVPDAAARSRFAKAALNRAAQEQAFVPYAKTLLDSSDAEVKALAKQSFAQ